MFQNITENSVQEEEKEIKQTNKIVLVCKQLFTIQNIIIYILTLLISMVQIKSTYIPLGLAMVAACLGSTVPVFLVYIVALIGTYIGMGSTMLSNTFWISILYFILVLIVKPKICTEERNEVYKTGTRLFWSYVIISIMNNWGSSTWLADLFYAGVHAGITYVFYKVFVNGIVVIKNLGIKKAYTAEEFIGAIIIISTALIALSGIQISGVSISYIGAFLMIALLGLSSGMLIGGTAGVTVGLTICFVQNAELNMLLVLTCAGIVAGLIRTIIHGTINIQDLIGRNKLLDNKGETRLNENSDVSGKLDELYKILEETFPEEKEPVSEEVQNRYEKFEEIFLDNLDEVQNNIFYDDFIQTETSLIRDVFETVEDNDIFLEENMVEIFKNNNNYIVMKDENIKDDLREIIKIVNRSYKMMQMDDIKKKEEIKAKRKIRIATKEVSKAIDKVATEIKEENRSSYTQKELEVKKVLNGKNIPAEEVFIKKLKNGKFIVHIKLDIKDPTLREKSKIANISDLISKTLGSKITFQKDKKNTENKTYVQTYSSEDKFIMQVGSAKISKDDSKASGDSNLQMRLDDGKYILAISDGMGSGISARENSKTVIQKLKSLIENGFEKEDSIKLINGTLGLKTEKDEYATLDICVLDLFEGNMSLIKNGACNTYVKNKKNLSIIESEEMPIGVGLEVNLTEKVIPVSDGDIILMCSDGLLESKDEIRKDWIEGFLKNVNTNNVQKIADMILAEAIDNSYGIAGDDITVIVAKIMKKK